MCLYNRVSDSSRVADEDIEVFKVVERDDEGVLRSPYQNMEYVVGGSYNSGLSREVHSLSRNLNDELVRLLEFAEERVLEFAEDRLLGHTTARNPVLTIGTVERGLHSFASLEDAKKFAHSDMRIDTHVVLRCVIPAGSEYYTGLWAYKNYMFGRGFLVDSYTSSALKVIEEVV